MKTTREILDAVDLLDVKMHALRSPAEAWETVGKDKVWRVSLTAEKSGVKVEVAFQAGRTFDEALAAAWAKFEPAASGGLPTLAITDASFTEVGAEEMPF